MVKSQFTWSSDPTTRTVSTLIEMVNKTINRPIREQRTAVGRCANRKNNR